MRTITRAAASAALAAAASLALSAPALAATQDQPGDPTVGGKPDTGNLHNKWTFAPLGVPVLGLVDSVTAVPGKLLPGGGTGPGGGN